MQGVIIENKSKDFAEFSSIITSLKGELSHYNWLITDIDFVPSKRNSLVLNQPYTWINGIDLEQIFDKEKGFWVWGVFSGFPKHIELSEILKTPLPYADGNEKLWSSSVQIQHPLALVEFIEWDGLCFLGITNEQVILSYLKEAYPTDYRELSRD